MCENCEDKGYTWEYCSACNGSGEGTHDGSICRGCNGLGEVQVRCDCGEEE